MIEIDMYSQTSAFVNTPPAINIDHIAMESVNLHGGFNLRMEVFVCRALAEVLSRLVRTTSMHLMRPKVEFSAV